MQPPNRNGAHEFMYARNNLPPSAVAALSTIERHQPPPQQPVPKYSPLMAKVGMPYTPGGDISGDIVYDDFQEVKDEVTAKHSAAGFNKFLNATRKNRDNLWSEYWSKRTRLNRDILRAEDEAFRDSQNMAAEADYSSDEGSSARHPRQISVPYMQANIGNLEAPRAPDYLIPDPQTVQRMQAEAARRMRAEAQIQAQLHAQAQAQAHAHAHAHGQPQMPTSSRVYPQGNIPTQHPSQMPLPPHLMSGPRLPVDPSRGVNGGTKYYTG